MRDIHLKALETKDFYQTKAASLEAKILADTTGSFWHQKEYIAHMHREAERLDRGDKGYLYGLSFGAKDLFCVEGLTTTAGSRILEGFKPQYTASLVDSIVMSGAMLSGKLAMDEFAMGSYTNTSPFGRVSKPGDITRTAGGSSGGSAASLGVLDFTLGSDTGGSIRQPAAYCGVVGYKPSYGTFSRFGMISYASSLDQAGICTKSVEDLDYLMSGLGARDEKDMTCKGLVSSGKVKTGRVAYLPELFGKSLSPDVERMYKDSIPTGAIAYEFKYMKYAAQIYYIIACAEAASNLARYQGVFYGEKLKSSAGSYWEQVASHRSEYFGSEVKKRIMLGSFITSSENFQTVYKKAQHLRAALTKEIRDCLREVDYLMLPTTIGAAPTWSEIGEMTSSEIYMADYLTVPFSLAGVAALTLPSGLQLVAEDDMFLIKSALELK